MEDVKCWNTEPCEGYHLRKCGRMEEIRAGFMGEWTGKGKSWHSGMLPGSMRNSLEGTKCLTYLGN